LSVNEVKEGASGEEETQMQGLLRKTLTTALVAGAGMAFAAAPASAGVLVKTATDCDPTVVSKPFAGWGDNANYFLAPGGAFGDAPDGWGLSGGARVVADNEPWNVSGDGSGALHIPNGATVTTPTMCVGLDHPTIRFFARRTSGLPLLASLAVSVQAETSLGLTVTVPVNAVLLSNSKWAPTGRMLLVANLLPLLPGELTPIRLKFTSLLGDFRIDDVYVDPRMTR
jgi:hypothetical protein